MSRTNFICGKCSKFLTYMDDDIRCDGFCNHRFHISCTEILYYSKESFLHKNFKWFCDCCCEILKHFKEIYDMELALKKIKISQG